MKKVIAYVHSHWDREWYREFEEFRLRLIEVFDEVLLALKSGELPCFYFDGQTAALEDYLEIYPEKLEQVKKLIKDKKLRVGPFYCSADSFLVSGECMCRNLEMGIKKSKELCETEFIGYLSDTFGHSQAMSKVLKSVGIDKACMWRGLGDLPSDRNWNGVEVTYLIQGYFQDFLNTNWSIEKKAEALKKYLDKIALKSGDNILLPIGADHLGIAKDIQKQLDNLNLKDYKFEIATPFEYFEKIKDRKVVEGEFLNNKLNFILPGVYSSRIDIKRPSCCARSSQAQ
jgi:alpha-mannosidase